MKGRIGKGSWVLQRGPSLDITRQICEADCTQGCKLISRTHPLRHGRASPFLSTSLTPHLAKKSSRPGAPYSQVVIREGSAWRGCGGGGTQPIARRGGRHIVHGIL